MSVADLKKALGEVGFTQLKKAVNIDDNGIVTLNGQVVEGITTLPGEESFSIK